MWASSVTFIKMSKENNHPMGENSPNLVTLIISIAECFIAAFDLFPLRTINRCAVSIKMLF
jgi:hypothetical protein